ncbi:unnamed protein product [Effrenium voratum]|nr:unnamed protein product [Effrenium voratum]
MEITVPDFMDCTGPLHGDWQTFRGLFRAAAEQTRETSRADGFEVPFPALHQELLDEAHRLYQKWHAMLAKGLEDYPTGAAAFYHACHFQEVSEYCLYGHVAAIAYLARYVLGGQNYTLARHGLRLLHWNHCLDFIESSSWSAWGFSALSLWDIAQSFAYPQVSLLHQYLEWGPGAFSAPGAFAAPESDATKAFWVFELGSHRALSNEPVANLQRALPHLEVTHQNFVKPYEGRAEAFLHPFPQHCSPNCPYQQESVPYSFPVFQDMEQSRLGFHAWIQGNYFNKPAIRKSSVFLCTNPVYYCNFFIGLNKTILGYFGLPLLYMVPQESWSRWIDDFIALASLPSSLFVSNNPLHSEQVAWQSGVRLPVLRPVVLYLKERYNPQRLEEVLVPEPREACVLYCVLRAFVPSGYPLRFLGKADTDRSYQSFVAFRAVVLFPHDFALMTFYEFYAMGVPLFMPSHLSKYLFPFSASVALLDWAPDWLATSTPSGERPPFSPLSLSTSEALRFWSQAVDFLALPGVRLFESLAQLLRDLAATDLPQLRALGAAMRRDRQSRLESGAAFWLAAAKAALR